MGIPCSSSQLLLNQQVQIFLLLQLQVTEESL
jgi:hypothetical protein